MNHGTAIKIKWAYEDDDGFEHEVQLPGIRVVCTDCEGEGFVLNEGMREHAYSAEEFQQEFDDEERAEYFKRGGRYDVQCPTCHGKNVEDLVDEETLQKQDPVMYKRWIQHQIAEAQWRAERDTERRFGY